MGLFPRHLWVGLLASGSFLPLCTSTYGFKWQQFSLHWHTMRSPNCWRMVTNPFASKSLPLGHTSPRYPGMRGHSSNCGLQTVYLRAMKRSLLSPNIPSPLSSRATVFTATPLPVALSSLPPWYRYHTVWCLQVLVVQQAPREPEKKGSPLLEIAWGAQPI